MASFSEDSKTEKLLLARLADLTGEHYLKEVPPFFVQFHVSDYWVQVSLVLLFPLVSNLLGLVNLITIFLSLLRLLCWWGTLMFELHH